MQKSFFRVFFLLLFVSCAAPKEGGNVSKPVAPPPQNGLPPHFKFSFFISATGLPDKPADSWTMDTTGMIDIRTAVRDSRQNYQNLNAMAALDPPDMDTLRMLIREGKLYAIDSLDVTQQCAGDEHYFVKIVPLTARLSAANLSFDACAGDYNLLLQPQRLYFRDFLDWWERMRVKYRPVMPH